MLSANFKPKRIAAASRGFLAIARLSCCFCYIQNIRIISYCFLLMGYVINLLLMLLMIIGLIILRLCVIVIVNSHYICHASIVYLMACNKF